MPLDVVSMWHVSVSHLILIGTLTDIRSWPTERQRPRKAISFLPSRETARREGVRQCQAPSEQAERRHSGGKGKRDESRNAEGRHSGQSKGKGKGRDAGPRPSGMDSAFDRPDFGVSSCFVYCLWMIWSGFFKISNEALNRIFESELYDKISRELSFILRHSGWTHADKSLTVFELMAGAQFRKTLSR